MVFQYLSSFAIHKSSYIIFLAEKNVNKLFQCKGYSQIVMFYIYNAFENVMSVNIVDFEQPGPDCGTATLYSLI